MRKQVSLLLLLILLLSSCHYHKDKLIIRNKTANKIYYETLVRDKNYFDYYQSSAGGVIPIYGTESPIVRGNANSINDELVQNSYDSYLYIVYYAQKDQEYVNKNIGNIVFDKRFKVDKYSLKELDSLNWTITYDGN